MVSIRDSLESKLSKVIAEVTGQSDVSANVVIASRLEFGDYQANGIMSVAKRLQTNPRELALKVVSALSATSTDGEMVESYEVAGPGFINIRLSRPWLNKRADELNLDISSLFPRANDPQTIVVDYSSPNLAKEMHVGHLRGTIIGDCLVRVLEGLGHNVIRQNHVGDWGTQFGMLIAYLQTEVKQESLGRELADLESFYRDAKAKFDKDPLFAEAARAAVVRLQSGDTQSLAIWQQFIEESLRHCEIVYDKLGVKIQRSDLRAESFYNSKLEGIVNELDSKGLLTVSDGAYCVFLDEFKGKDGETLPVIVRKSDGGFLYSTTDLAAIQFRTKELAADRVLYVVDARQSLHFKQVFALARQAGLASEHCTLEHIAYGTMMGKDGKPFKTRSGSLIRLIDLLDEAIRRAFVLVSEKNPDLDLALRKQIAETVGIAAVKYADLSITRTNDYTFDWDSMLSFEGNTAPYLLYAYTRIRSVLRKREELNNSAAKVQIEEAEERALVIKLLQFPEVLQVVAKDAFPNQLCSYLYDLAVLFMRFYEACPILKSKLEIRDSRLALVNVTAEVLKEGLGLLGLQTLEQM